MVSEIIIKAFRENYELRKREILEDYFRWRDWNENCSGKIILFGAASMCGICMNFFEKLGIKIDLICDNNADRYGNFVLESGREVSIVSVNEAMEQSENILCFLSAGAHHFPAICEQLKQYNISELVKKFNLALYLDMLYLLKNGENFCQRMNEMLKYYDDDESKGILWTHYSQLFEFKNAPDELKDFSFEKICIRPQYFLDGGKYLGRQGIMIDCGAYNGDTLNDLLDVVKYKNFERYDCYEMDSKSLAELMEYVCSLGEGLSKKIKIIGKGVGEKEEELHYFANGLGSCFLESGNGIAYVTALDNNYGDKDNITFIKMDIEGSEQEAIRGARHIISKNKPMCAICIYHTVASFWEIPQMLKSLVPEYKFLLKHHTDNWPDTVCYAKISEW